MRRQLIDTVRRSFAKSLMKQIEERAREANSLLCVGLDPHPEFLSEQTAAGALDFCTRMIDATQESACAFKPNSAFFEVFGGAGLDALREAIAYVPEHIPVILDAKRGDIDSTAEAYARAAFDVLDADAVTINPYLGFDAVEPFIRRTDKGAFVLCRTSNPDAITFQEFRGHPAAAMPDQTVRLYELVAVEAMRWNVRDNVGLVVGATDPEALADVRLFEPNGWLLVPGVGAQGGDLDATVRVGVRRADRLGMLVNVSRSLARHADPRAEAARLRDAINKARADLPTFRDHTPDDLWKLAKGLADAGCVQFGEFTLKSGQQSPIYLDLRRLVSRPDALAEAAEALNRVLARLRFKHIAAIPYAALPIATVAAQLTRRSLIYPRKEVKAYGTGASIEGVFKKGDVAVIVDDLATTGESKFETIDKLEAAGLEVRDVVVVIDREGGAREALKARDVGFHAVARLRDLLEMWHAQGIVSSEQRAQIEAYLSDQPAPAPQDPPPTP